MNVNNVQNVYWDSGNSNNTLYAVRVKTDVSSCVLSVGGNSDQTGAISSDQLENLTSLPNCGPLTAVFTPDIPLTKSITITAYLVNDNNSSNLVTTLDSHISGRCDVSLSMFYTSLDFSPNVTKLAKWIDDNG